MRVESRVSPPPPVEDVQKEEEHVEGIEKDRCRQQWCRSRTTVRAKALKIEHGETCKDHQSGTGVDERTVLYLREDGDDAEDDESQEGLGCKTREP